MRGGARRETGAVSRALALLLLVAGAALPGCGGRLFPDCGCMANPRGANPCDANPCGANPCGANPCASNPCDANPCQRVGSTEASLPPAPPSGTAWRIVGDAGAVRVSGHVEDPARVVFVDEHGQLQVHLPPSPETAAALEKLGPRPLDALQIRRAKSP